MDDKSPWSSPLFNLFKSVISPFGSNSSSRESGDSLFGNGASSSPRDSLLKPEHRTDPSGEPYSDNQSIFPNHSYSESPERDFQWESQGQFSHEFPGAHFDSVFGMMDELFKGVFQFHPGHEFDDGSGFHGGHGFPSIEPSIPDEERKDTDLDESSGNAINSLLKKGSPKFSVAPHGPQGSPGGFVGGFKSTSIVKIRKPDGTIEETRKYRDSTGKEEVEVITREPSDSAPQDHQMIDPSLFSDNPMRNIFKGFPSFPFF